MKPHSPKSGLSMIMAFALVMSSAAGPASNACAAILDAAKPGAVGFAPVVRISNSAEIAPGSLSTLSVFAATPASGLAAPSAAASALSGTPVETATTHAAPAVGNASHHASDAATGAVSPHETAGALTKKIWNHARAHGFADDDQQGAALPSETGAQAAADGAKLSPAAETPGAPKTDPPAPEPSKISKMKSGANGFFASFLMLQLVVESTALAGPQMADPYSPHGMMRLGMVVGGIYLAYAKGSYVGSHILKRLGWGANYTSVLIARTAIWATMYHYYDPATQTVPIAILITLFCIDYFVHSLGRVDEHALHAYWSENSSSISNRFAQRRDGIEYGTVFSTMIVAALIGAHGFKFVFQAAPYFFAASAAITAYLVYVRKTLPKTIPDAVVDIGAGIKAIFANAQLKSLFIGQLLLNNFFYLLVYVTSIAFAVYSSNGDKDYGAALTGSIFSFYGLGALFAAVVVNPAISNRIEKQTASITDEAEQTKEQNRLYSIRAVSAMKWAAVGLAAGIGFFLNHTKLWAPHVVLPGLGWDLGLYPIYPICIAMAFTGLTAQVALTLLDPLFKQKIPKGMKTAVVGANRTLSYLSYAVNFFVWCWLFQAMGAAAFYPFIAVSLAFAGAYLWLARGMKKSS